MKSAVSVIAGLMLSALIFTGCGDVSEQKVSMEGASSSQSSQLTQTPTPELTKSDWER